MTPLVDIVTGTYDRFAHLTRMVESARRAVPPSLPVRFIIVDGGSTDGTIEWCKAQPDVLLIEHGELRGAIRAFCDGAKAATAPYVLMANDDITFDNSSIAAALAYLEAHPTCGAVAFADDRPAPGKKPGMGIQTMQARRDGETVHVPYAQVGLFRRFLGDLAGWWGADHPVMSKGHTYGSDNFLTARVLELGYTVDPVDGVSVHDGIPNDALRDINYRAEMANPAVYYKVYPQGPEIAATPQVPNPQAERLRILYLPLLEPTFGYYKRGLLEALQRVGLVWELDYVNAPFDLAAICRAWQPHVVLTQLHGTDKVMEADVAAARAAAPGAIWVNWNGDTYRDKLIDKPMLSLLRHFDLQLVVNASVIPIYEQRGIKAAYWQVAFEPVDYGNLPRVASHDVVFLANAYTPERRQLGAVLRAMEGVDVGLYGASWPYGNGITTYNFAVGAALYNNAKIAIGDNGYAEDRGFVSNRVFEALASGAFLLHQRVEGLQELTGLVSGYHYDSFTDLDDLQRAIRYWLNPAQDEARRRIAEQGRQFVHAEHSFDARVRDLFERLIPMTAGNTEGMVEGARVDEPVPA